MRGDEPEYLDGMNAETEACPTCVGMNRYFSEAKTWTASLPHMRGDEPVFGCGREFSVQRLPHMRGDEPKT